MFKRETGGPIKFQSLKKKKNRDKFCLLINIDLMLDIPYFIAF